MSGELIPATNKALSILPAVDSEQSLNLDSELSVLQGFLIQTAATSNAAGSRAILELLNKYNRTIAGFEWLEPKQFLFELANVFAGIVADEFGIDDPQPIQMKFEETINGIQNGTQSNTYGNG